MTKLTDEIHNCIKENFDKKVTGFEKSDNNVSVRFKDPYLTSELYEQNVYITKKFLKELEKKFTTLAGKLTKATGIKIKFEVAEQEKAWVKITPKVL